MEVLTRAVEAMLLIVKISSYEDSTEVCNSVNILTMTVGCSVLENEVRLETSSDTSKKIVEDSNGTDTSSILLIAPGVEKYEFDTELGIMLSDVSAARLVGSISVDD